MRLRDLSLFPPRDRVESVEANRNAPDRAHLGAGDGLVAPVDHRPVYRGLLLCDIDGRTGHRRRRASVRRGQAFAGSLSCGLLENGTTGERGRLGTGRSSRTLESHHTPVVTRTATAARTRVPERFKAA
jgi:hypothetical protein